MRTENVLGKMAEIVEGYLTNYKEDFYKYDTEWISEEHPREFIWFIRPTGTHMMIAPITEGTPEEVRENKDEWHHLYGIFKRMNKRYYYVRMNEDGSGEITQSERRCDEFMKRVTGRSAA